jgi:hypothetical protein
MPLFQTCSWQALGTMNVPASRQEAAARLVTLDSSNVVDKARAAAVGRCIGHMIAGALHSKTTCH